MPTLPLGVASLDESEREPLGTPPNNVIWVPPDSGLIAPGMKSPKLQRWLDLLAALLRRHYPVTFEELIPDVPDYAAARAEARVPPPHLRARQGRAPRVRRADRDHARPRRRGRTTSSGSVTSTSPISPSAGPLRPPPRKIDRYGYQSLPSLAFEPDELAAVAAASARVRQLGDPLLAEHAESANAEAGVRPARGCRGARRARHPPGPAPGPRLLRADGTARRRAPAENGWHSATARWAAARTARARSSRSGSSILNQHWYLAARGPGEATVKNYRLSRIAEAKVNPGRPGTPDYEIPAGFDLRAHARSRQAWELGAGDAVDATVHFRSPPAPRPPRTGSARRSPATPTAASSGSAAPTPSPAGSSPSAVIWSRSPPATWSTSTWPGPRNSGSSSSHLPSYRPTASPPMTAAADQFRRILHLIPLFADGEAHPSASSSTRPGSIAM